MKLARPIDSDPHNFGLKCTVADDQVFKPRCIFGEYQIFSRGPFRQFLKEIRGEEFSLLPYLEFSAVVERPTTKPQAMEFISTSAVTARLSDPQIVEIGEIYGLMAALGVSDLHHTNVIFGMGQAGPIFAPVDLEMFYIDFSIHGKGFLHPRSPHFHCCGARSLFSDYLSKFPDPDFSCKLYYGMRKFLRTVDSRLSEFYQSFEGNEFGQIPIRVIQRKTMDYAEMLKGEIAADCSHEERIQLERGDVPYFFAFPQGGDIYFWETPSSYRKAKKNQKIFSGPPQLPPSSVEPIVATLPGLFLSWDYEFNAFPAMTGYADVSVVHRESVKYVSADGLQVAIKLESECPKD